MNKLRAVIKKEYITVVRKKSFIIMTILIPLMVLLLMSLPFLMANVRTGVTTVAIIDESGLLVNRIEGNRNLEITFIEGDVEVLKDTFMSDFDALIFIPNFDLRYIGGIRLYSEKQIGMTNIRSIERQMERIIENERFIRAGIDRELIDRLRVRIRIESIVLTEAGERAGDSTIAFMVGYISGFIMYFILLFYGSMIMNTVMNEKRTRIIEILMSSIRPFELMLGKIIGLAGVALTQLLIWGVLISIIMAFFTVGVMPRMQANIEAMEVPAEMQGGMAMQIMEFIEDPGVIDFTSIIILLVVYSILGYLFYSTMYAAVGSLADDDGQSQNFSMAITIPIILSMFIMLNVVDNPHSPLAFWASMIPFSAPIVMMVRVPFQVPVWQLVLSIGVLTMSFLAATWVSGKIYRTAVMMFGKKFVWGDLWRMVVRG